MYFIMTLGSVAVAEKQDVFNTWLNTEEQVTLPVTTQ